MLRKSIYLFVICIFGFYASFASGADRTERYFGKTDTETIFFDDFESYTLGSGPGSGGWQLIYNGAGTSSQYVDNIHSVSGSKSLHLVGSSCWAASAQHPVNFPNRLSYKAKVLVDQIVNCGCTPYLAAIDLNNPNIGTWGSSFGKVSFNCDGKIYAGQSTYDQGQDVLLMPYDAGKWYEVKLNVDLTARVFDVYIDGVLLASGLQIMDSGMPTNIDLGAGHGGNPTVWFDDAKVSSLLNSNVLKSYDIQGKETVKISIKGHKSQTVKVAFSDEFTFYDDGYFAMTDMDGTWSQKKSKFAINLNPVSVSQYFADNLSAELDSDVFVAVTKITFTGTEQKNGNVKGSFKIYMTFYIEDYDLSGKITVSGSFKGTPQQFSTASIKEKKFSQSSNSILDVIEEEVNNMAKSYPVNIRLRR
jgi:hypothetical protein